MSIKDLSKSQCAITNQAVRREDTTATAPVLCSRQQPWPDHLDMHILVPVGVSVQVDTANFESSVKSLSPWIRSQAEGRGCFSMRLPLITINTWPLLRASWWQGVLNSTETLPVWSEGYNSHSACHIHKPPLCEHLNYFIIVYVPVSSYKDV